MNFKKITSLLLSALIFTQSMGAGAMKRWANPISDYDDDFSRPTTVRKHQHHSYVDLTTIEEAETRVFQLGQQACALLTNYLSESGKLSFPLPDNTLTFLGDAPAEVIGTKEFQDFRSEFCEIMSEFRSIILSTSNLRGCSENPRIQNFRPYLRYIDPYDESSITPNLTATYYLGLIFMNETFKAFGGFTLTPEMLPTISPEHYSFRLMHEGEYTSDVAFQRLEHIFLSVFLAQYKPICDRVHGHRYCAYCGSDPGEGPSSHFVFTFLRYTIQFSWYTNDTFLNLLVAFRHYMNLAAINSDRDSDDMV